MATFLGRPWRSALDLLVSLAVIVLCGTLTWSHLVQQPKPTSSRTQKALRTRPELAPPSAPVSLAGASTMGARSATVALIEYADFQCPYCGVFARTTLPDLETRYIRSGKVLFAFRNLPLESIHSTALIAAQAGACAAAQGKFWPMHEWIFGNQKRLTLTTLESQASSLQLDTAAFSTCLYSDGVARVKAEEEAARSLQIDGTPTFFIGRIGADGTVNVTKRLTGARSPADLAVALDALLTTATEQHAPPRPH